MNVAPLFGILVGGLGSRMGGRAKGLLRGPSGETLIEQLVGLCRTVSPESSILLLGKHSAYSAMSFEILPDLPGGIGPLGGVCALLNAAARGTPLQPELRSDQAVVLGCDLPYLSAPLLARLVTHPSKHAVSVQMDGRWNPVFARYPVAALSAVETLIIQGEQRMQHLLHLLQAEPLSVSELEANALRDWDTDADMRQ